MKRIKSVDLVWPGKAAVPHSTNKRKKDKKIAIKKCKNKRETQNGRENSITYNLTALLLT